MTPESRIEEPEKMPADEQRFGKQISAVINTHARTVVSNAQSVVKGRQVFSSCQNFLLNFMLKVLAIQPLCLRHLLESIRIRLL
jgi:hypothetical protein